MICTKCGVEKDASQFGIDRKQCYDCRRKYNKENRRGDLQANREVSRERNSIWRAENSMFARAADRMRREKNPTKLRIQGNARSIVYRAILRGLLIKPEVCEVCGNQGKIEAHHEDYSKPLKVNWLCDACHDGLRSLCDSPSPA